MAEPSTWLRQLAEAPQSLNCGVPVARGLPWRWSRILSDLELLSEAIFATDMRRKILFATGSTCINSVVEVVAQEKLSMRLAIAGQTVVLPYSVKAYWGCLWRGHCWRAC